jgi:hypothetical protein
MMQTMLAATSSFMNGLEQWLKAVRADDFAAAKQYAEHFTMHADLLVIHPDFQRCFREHCQGADPKEALYQLCQFLLCATEGRARHLKQWVQENRPITS